MGFAGPPTTGGGLGLRQGLTRVAGFGKGLQTSGAEGSGFRVGLGFRVWGWFKVKRFRV